MAPWTVPHQVPLSMGFPRQAYWSGLPFPPPVDIPNPGMESTSPVSPALAGRFFATEPPGKPLQQLFQSVVSLFYTERQRCGSFWHCMSSRLCPGLVLSAYCVLTTLMRVAHSRRSAGTVLIAIHRGGHPGSERLSNLVKTTQPRRYKAEL